MFQLEFLAIGEIRLILQFALHNDQKLHIIHLNFIFFKKEDNGTQNFRNIYVVY